MGPPQRLPMEIILHIIDSVVDDPGTIYRPSDPVTKTLLSFTLVCRATHTAAVNHLRRQCMYIDDEKRLADCVAYLKATNGLVPEYNAGNIDVAKVIPPGARLRPITSLYLAGLYHNPTTVLQIIELCALVAPSLARLILDLPLWFNCPRGANRSDYMEAFQSETRAYVQAFLALTELTDFISVREACIYPFLFDWVTPNPATPIANRYPWNFWPKLRRLALHDVEINRNFWHSVRKAEQLDTLFLTTADWELLGFQKTAFLQFAHFDLEASENGTRTLASPRPIRIVFGNYSNSQHRHTGPRNLRAGASNWPLIDPENLIKLRLFDLPVSPTNVVRKRRVDAREYIVAAALRNEIWSWKGKTIS